MSMGEDTVSMIFDVGVDYLNRYGVDLRERSGSIVTVVRRVGK